MLPYYFTVFLSVFLIGILASYFDFKDRIVPDILHILVAVAGLSFSAYLYFYFQSPEYIIAKFIGFSLFFAVGLIFWKMDTLGGADIKHLMAYGLVLPYFDVNSMLFVVFSFNIVLMVVSLIYMGIYFWITKQKTMAFIPVFPISLAIQVFINYLYF